MSSSNTIKENIMKKYILILFAFLMASGLKAQTSVSITPRQEREFYHKAYELMMKYSQNASLSDEDEETRFRELFVSEEVQLGNDLMSLSHEQTLSLDNYIQTLQEARSVKVNVSNLKKIGDVTETEDAWLLDLLFEKSISYGKCGTWFESKVYFGENYKLIATISLNKENGACKIAGLKIDPDAYPPLIFPSTFTVLERTSEDENKRDYLRDNKLTIDGVEAVTLWNRYNQIILLEGQKVKYNNSQVDEEVINEDKCGGRKIHANYNDKSFRVRANAGLSLSGFNKLDASKSGITSKDGETSFGVDFGYAFPSTSKFYFGLFAGVGMSMNNLSMNMKPDNGNNLSSEIKNCTADEDGDTYTRHYSVGGNGITQKFSTSELTIPIYADFEYQLIPLLSVYADLGLRFQMTSDQWEAQIDSYTTYGTYNQYNGLTIDGSVNVNGFGTYSARTIDVNRENMKSGMAICPIMGLGLRSNVSKSFAIDLGVQYLMGGKSWNTIVEDAALFSYTLPEGWQTMSPESKAKGDSVNLLNLTNGIKHNAFRVTLGLIFKF